MVIREEETSEGDDKSEDEDSSEDEDQETPSKVKTLQWTFLFSLSSLSLINLHLFC